VVTDDAIRADDLCCFESIFTALHEMQMRSSDANSVRSSVRLSNAWIVTKRKKIQSIFLHNMKDHLA